MRRKANWLRTYVITLTYCKANRVWKKNCNRPKNDRRSKLRWLLIFFIRKTHQKFVKVKAWTISFETFILCLLCFNKSSFAETMAFVNYKYYMNQKWYINSSYWYLAVRCVVYVWCLLLLAFINCNRIYFVTYDNSSLIHLHLL